MFYRNVYKNGENGKIISSPSASHSKPVTYNKPHCNYSETCRLYLAEKQEHLHMKGEVECFEQRIYTNNQLKSE